MWSGARVGLGPKLPKIMLTSTENELWGEYEQSVDDKGRIVLPQDLRAPLGDEFVITRGPDRAVWLLPKIQWEQIYQQIKPGATNSRQAALLQRQHGGRAYAKTDAQNRLTVPKHIRDYAGIDEDHKAVLIGVGDKIELWNKETWDAYNRALFNSDVVYAAAEELDNLRARQSESAGTAVVAGR
jgi:MraZ protein